MIVPCEIAAKAVVPTIRAMVAKKLNQDYHMKQNDIANLLGITQSAVSQYLSNIRGRALVLEGIEEVEPIVQDLVHIIVAKHSNTRFIGKKYCEACRIVREKRMLCQLHRRLDPMFDISNCDLCMPTSVSCV
jgi:predicted transcriptional regulator